MIGVHASEVSSYNGLLSAKLAMFRCVQIFLRGPLGRGRAFSDPAEQKAIRDLDRIIIVHAPFNLNPCRALSVHYFKEQVRLSHRIGARAYVIHVGHAVGQTVEGAKRNLTRTIWEVLRAVPDIEIWLETPAGQGTEYIVKPREMADFLSSEFSHEHRVGLCIDTAHVFVAGYLPSEYVKEFVRDCQPGVLRCIHLNDSRWPRDSRRDQHADLGEGEIPVEELLTFYALGKKLGIPMILETPSHIRSIATLRYHCVLP